MGVFKVGKRGWRVQQKVSPVNRMRLIIPGITMRNMGSSFMYPHMMQPAFTCDMFLAERQRCTMTCQGKPSEGGCKQETLQYVLTTPAPTTTLGRQPGTPISPRLSSPQTTGACPAFPTSCTKGRKLCSTLGKTLSPPRSNSMGTWSVHQYHREMMVSPKMSPGQGRSPLRGSRKMWKESALGM